MVLTYEILLQGDSGGPLFITETDNKVTLVGVTSFGSSAATLENPNADVYVRVTSFLPWIYNSTGIAERKT